MRAVSRSTTASGRPSIAVDGERRRRRRSAGDRRARRTGRRRRPSGPRRTAWRRAPAGGCGRGAPSSAAAAARPAAPRRRASAIVRDGSGPRCRPVRAGVLDDGQARPRRVDVEADVAVAVGAGAGAVVPGPQPGDQAGLDDLGRQRVGQAVVAHRLGLAQHRTDAPAVLLAEVAAHPLAQVGRLADVEHLVAVPAEQVHAGRAGQVRRQLELGRLRVAGHRRQRREVVEAEHAEPGRPLDQQVQQVGRGQGVVEGAVGRAVVEPEPRRQRARAGSRAPRRAPAGGPGRRCRP